MKKDAGETAVAAPASNAIQAKNGATNYLHCQYHFACSNIVGALDPLVMVK